MRGFISLSGIIFLLSVSLVAGGAYYLYEKEKEAKHDFLLEEISEGLTKATTTFYVRVERANIRSCPPLIEMDIEDCIPVEQVTLNTEINLPYETLESMPEWISLTWKGKDAYINKSVLASHPVTSNELDDDIQAESKPSATNNNSLSSLAEKIEAAKQVPEPTKEELTDLVWLCNVADSDVDCSINFYDSCYHDLAFRTEINAKIKALRQ